MKYRSTKTVEALTFEEFVQVGLSTPGANIRDGVPWAFEYKGANVTHETDDRYRISGKNDDGLFSFNFERGGFLVWSDEGEKLYPMPVEWFYELYEPIVGHLLADLTQNSVASENQIKPLVLVDAQTGKPCPTHGKKLCTIEDRNHRHASKDAWDERSL